LKRPWGKRREKGFFFLCDLKLILKAVWKKNLTNGEGMRKHA
jgi:hypothetical protein